MKRKDQQPDKPEKQIRIMLADDHLIVREGLVTVRSEEPDFEFVGFAEDGEQACEEYAKLLPDVLLLDLRMPKRDGLEVAHELVGKFQAKVIILTTFDNEEDLKQSLKTGAKGYLLKEAEKEEIANAVRTVSAGDQGGRECRSVTADTSLAVKFGSRAKNPTTRNASSRPHARVMHVLRAKARRSSTSEEF